LELRTAGSRTRVPDGIALSDDGTLRVVSGGRLYCVASDGIRWCTEDAWIAPPTCLSGGRVLVLRRRRFSVLDGKGEVVSELPFDFPVLPSHRAPNVAAGVLLASSPNGELWGGSADGFHQIGDFGIDLEPPAVFDDGSLGVAGYDAGYCRVRLDGTIIWETRDWPIADLNPTIARDQRSAVGAFDDNSSHIYEADGSLLGIYPAAAVFSEHQMGWVAVSGEAVALLTPEGVVRWQLPIRRMQQAVVDVRGRIYASDEDGLVCLDTNGTLVFVTELPDGPARSLAPIGPGRLAALCGEELLILE
jgi:hypothetical protein